ncbi:rho GTPase-activating protein 5 [Amborella trichopoda]|uniref:Rho-GAP domain-containing protein n=1 Tax=Amborella trichopoda TaxID=13333 RepID=U5D3M1_AMBTC|nr:rho GTPase-activating protein 5 [Amborella trichopoda]ERN16845.1 hypothetical protein AMTR_s00057p00129680 [Amborella trichopoda]|eukprot:XP_006855378.1 rho GTPase-activating protein 5 [Amborella trichopoda]
MAQVVMVSKLCPGRGNSGEVGKERGDQREDESAQISLLALLLDTFRRSLVSCRVREEGEKPQRQMEIGWPTNVRHVAHVTFDRFNGFLGLPVEFETEVPRKVPSASASVFGVSAESMQCSYDSKGNSVPTILLLLQERLYAQGALKAEGIFRINPENGQEEHLRDQLNKGIVPHDTDVHCLAGLIKAWFRELPSGVLDGLSPEQVLQCNTEEECLELVKLLLPTQAALLNWAVNLMTDVVEEEEFNKMNARNIAMVFAPNMTQMADPLTALMHAVQVMNLLKTLILRSLRARQETETGGYSPFFSSPDQHAHDEDENDDADFDDDYDGFDSQQESVGMSCELRASDYDEEEGHDSPECRDGGEDIECFLRSLNEKEAHLNEPDLLGRKIGSDCSISPSSGSSSRASMRIEKPLKLSEVNLNVESKTSIPESKNESSITSVEESEESSEEIYSASKKKCSMEICR